MKIAYFDCFSGISGDMIVGSLLDAGLDFSELENEIKKLGLKNVGIKASKIVKQNIASTKFDVIYEEQKHHRHLKDLNDMVENSTLDAEVIETAKKVFMKIAVAEAKIHDMPLEKVHFHEVGAVDTIVDVVAALAGFKKLGIEKVYCSKLNVGSGFVTFSHGKFPVPAPATAEILKNVPSYSTDSKGELVTPTGAAIITAIADSFGDMPLINTSAIGYGAGSKDFEHPNVLRLFIGEAGDQMLPEDIYVIETNIDDMNPQWYDHIMDRLYMEGALEVFFSNIQMKKNRPGTKLTILTKPANKEKLINIIFRETTSIGVRIRKEEREILKREVGIINTQYGEVKVKTSWYNDQKVNFKVEYDDLKRLAIKNKMSLKQISEEIDNLIISKPEL
ncbi:MAG: nickel pincer cofactor biosynthesis protein LarC [Bacteroidales bacterium]